jgi:hypothetical protein
VRFWADAFVAALFAVGLPVPVEAAPTIAITGATLVDVSNGGRSAHDTPDAVVVIEGDRILAAGPRRSTPIPPQAKVIPRPGKFILPGLIDGFSGLQSQAEANAELYEGVTTIVGSGDERRGHLFEHASPSPHLYAMDSAGSTDDWSLLREQPEWRDKLAEGDHPHELAPAETKAQLAATAKRGTRAIWIGWNITRDNARVIVAESHRLGMVTYGEFISTPYAAGLSDGVDVLLHMSRYELGLAPAALIAPLATAPYGEEAKVAYGWIDTIDPASSIVSDYGKAIAERGVALMPTFSLYYLVLPDHRNLWKEPAAALLDPHGLFRPSDPVSGELTISPALRPTNERNALHLWQLNESLMAQGPTYLAGSGASAFGALPGMALHVELELLVRRGLSPRQALAAATSNYSTQFHWSELGLVEAGRRADLLIVDADPAQKIENAARISDVVLSGAWLDREALLKAQKPR